MNILPYKGDHLMNNLKVCGSIVALCTLCTACAVNTKPLTRDDIMQRVTVDREAMFKNQEPITAPICLDEAMARSVKYKLDHRLKILHTSISQVRQAYWLALGAQQLEGRFEPLLKAVEQALKDTDRIEKEK